MQNDNNKCYHIRLANLRRLLEGSKFLSTLKKQIGPNVVNAEDEPIPEAVAGFFKSMKVETVSEFTPHFKILKYTFDFPDSSSLEAQSEFYMLLSY